MEYRAHLRGWSSPLFGKANSLGERGSGAALPAARVYGPTADFPFRSRIVDAEKGERITRILDL